MNKRNQVDEIFQILQTGVPSPPHQVLAREKFLAEARRLGDEQPISHDQPILQKTGHGFHLNRKWLPTMSFLTLILLIVGIVVAQQIFDFFRQSETDQQAIPVRFGTGGQIVNTPKTLEEAVKLVDYEIAVPTFVPEAYQFGEVYYWREENSLSIHYQCGTFRELILAQRPMSSNEAANLNQLDVGASASIETVAIGDTTGQYVRGAWIVKDNIRALAATAIAGTPIPAQSVWENDSELQTLYWYADGILYVLSNIGSRIDVGTAGECTLDKDDYAAVANSMAK